MLSAIRSPTRDSGFGPQQIMVMAQRELMQASPAECTGLCIIEWAIFAQPEIISLNPKN